MLQSLLPTKAQWTQWSKPTKYQFIGLLLGLAALLIPVSEIIRRAIKSEPHLTYSQGRVEYVQKLSDASICLAGRLNSDDLYPLESDCQIDLRGLSHFIQQFAPYMALTPYSGAWNLERYSRVVEQNAPLINASSNRSELAALLKQNVSLAETAYYLCGLEWYLRSAAPDRLAPISKEGVRSYQVAWMSWQAETGDRVDYAPYSSTKDEILDDPDCSSFIDLLD
jgi:hypothetical protein